MNLAIFKSRSLALTSVFVIVSLIAVGWIYSRFPADWLQPTNTRAVYSLSTKFLFELSKFPAMFTLFSLPIAVLATILSKGVFRLTAKHALFVIPLIPGLLMLAWGSYCCLQSRLSVYPIGDYSTQYSSIVEFLTKIPWYSRVITDVFFSEIIYLIGLAFYVIRSVTWKGERWMAVWAIVNDAIWIYYLCAIGLWLSARPPI